MRKFSIALTIFGLALGFSLHGQSLAQLEQRCSSETLGLNEKLETWKSLMLTGENATPAFKELIFPKMECVYEVMGIQLGGLDRPVPETLQNGQFRAVQAAMLGLGLTILNANHAAQIRETCPGVKDKAWLSSPCVLSQFPEALDAILTVRAINEVAMPSLLLPPPSHPQTWAEREEAQIGFLKQVPNLR